MSNYRGTANRPDQAKALAAVVAIHVLLALVILSGLNVRSIRRVVEPLTTIAIAVPPIPPPPRIVPKPEAAPRKPAGAPAKQAEPSPVVAPPAKLPVPSPIVTAKVAGTGSASASGAAPAETGSGAGGIGNGAGGGGNSAGFTPARRISKIPDREYRMLSATGLRSGSVGVTVRVNPDGGVANCRVARSSGDGSIDGLMCQLALRYLRFDPARDSFGRPVAQDVTFFPNWWRP